MHADRRIITPLTCSEVLGRLSAAFSFWQRLQSFTMYGKYYMNTGTCSRRVNRVSLGLLMTVVRLLLLLE